MQLIRNHFYLRRIQSSLRFMIFSAVIAISASFAIPAHADRLILAPEAETPAPNAVQTEWLISPSRHNDSYLWLSYSSNRTVEYELQRTGLSPDPEARYSLNIEYPFTIDFGPLPAISLGIRDILGTGNEHDAVYLVAGHSAGLSESAQKYIRHVRFTAGLGTGEMEGPFTGVELALTNGIALQAEFYRHRPDFGITAPILRGLQAQIASLNGRAFYGFTLHILH